MTDTDYHKQQADAIQSHLLAALIDIEDKDLAFRHIEKAERMMQEIRVYVARYNQRSG